MGDMIKESIKRYLSRSGNAGECLNEKELITLNTKLHGLIPDWYIEAVTQVPIAGVELGWQASPATDDFNGIQWVSMLDIKLLQEINIESYPGSLLWPLGYFTFGYGAAWAGNCFAFSPAESDNPAVFEVWHDAAYDEAEMQQAFKLQKGVRRVSDSVSRFFDDAVIQ